MSTTSTSLFQEVQPIPLEAQIACVTREIAMRERVYARWVADKKMTQKTADREIALMRAVLLTLETLKKEKAQ